MKLRALCRIQGTHRSRQSKSVTLPWQTQTGVGKHISRALGNRPSLPNPSSSPASNASSLNQTGTSSSVSQMVESALPAPGTAALSSMQRCLPARPPVCAPGWVRGEGRGPGSGFLCTGNPYCYHQQKHLSKTQEKDNHNHQLLVAPRATGISIAIKPSWWREGLRTVTHLRNNLQRFHGK